MNDIKIHIESEVKGCSRYVDGSNAWLIRDATVGKLAEKLMKLLNIPIVTNSALRAKVEKLEKENEFLRFMVENGLGEDDLKNDITLPHDITR